MTSLTGATPLELMTSPLYAEYTLWLNDEAEQLDRHRYSEWLERLAPDLHYTVPGRTDGPDGVVEGASHHIDETYRSMTTRIKRISGATNFAETPRTRTRRFVTNIRLSPESTPDRLVGSSYLLLTRSRGLRAELEMVPCERTDELVRIDGQLKLRRRQVLVDQATLGLVHLATPL
ncbi:MAG TPA: aromatic-ring-hydroxylating dioxygenase subunit beta [Pseudonocardia sp.]|nr:aromatic-ring-hydroxylating dioxygenase subunit beta [Pseudonocardia sp.]